jgi:seryl-tRNA synthetase
MLDIKFIRDNQDKVAKAITDKNMDLDLEELLSLDQRRRELLTELESLQATKNQVSKEIPSLDAEAKQAKILEMQEVDKKQTEVAGELKLVQERFDVLMLRVPNIPSQESPIGKDDSENLPWRYWHPELGEVDPKDEAKVALVQTKFDFEIKDHVTLMENLGLVDLEAGVKTSGFRGYYLKNEAVLMQYGLLWHAMDKLRAKGFTLMATPTLVRDFALVGSGHFPFGKDEIYQIVNSVVFQLVFPIVATIGTYPHAVFLVLRL